MKTPFGNLIGITTLVFATALAARTALAEKPMETAGKTNAAPVVAAVPKSNFGIPTKPEEGRDPFFPGSDRLFATKSAPAKVAGVTAPSLVVNGISGTREKPLAMINGHTFGEGEEAALNIGTARVHVRCLEIKGDVVVIEANGERRELHFQNR